MRQAVSQVVITSSSMTEASCVKMEIAQEESRRWHDQVHSRRFQCVLLFSDKLLVQLVSPRIARVLGARYHHLW